MFGGVWEQKWKLIWVKRSRRSTAGGAKQCALVARGQSMPRAGILIDFMSTHIDFLLILRLGEKCAVYLKLPDTRIPDEKNFTVLLLFILYSHSDGR